MDNYPPGAANDPNAPYNQVDPEPVELDVTVSITMSKTVTIEVDDYQAEFWEDYDQDEEGHVIHNGGIDYDFRDCDLNGAYKEQEFTLEELLKELKTYVEADMENTAPNSGKGIHLKHLLKACDGWVEDEFEVVEG